MIKGFWLRCFPFLSLIQLVVAQEVSVHANDSAPQKKTQHEILNEILIHGDLNTYQKQSLAFVTEDERDAAALANIATWGSSVPVGRWALMRSGKKTCAIRFTAFRRSHTADHGFDWFAESFFAEYDWVYRGDGGESFVGPSTRSGSDEVYQKPNIWRIMRQPGIHCGELKADWLYPNKIKLISWDFNMETRNHSNGIEIAITGWRDIADVNPHDPRLTWVYYDPARDTKYLYGKDEVIVPVAELVGASE